MRPLLIIKAGTKLASLAHRAGDYEHWILQGMGLRPSDAVIYDVEQPGPLPTFAQISGVVITGSASNVTEELAWMAPVEAWLAKMVQEGMPVLGICFGHQLLAKALGGVVGFNRKGVEVGTVTLHLTHSTEHDRLFHGLPVEFQSQVSHRQTITELPPGAIRLAWNERESTHAFAFAPCAWGVQFHPEFDADTVSRYIDNYAAILGEERRSVDTLRQRLQDDPTSALVLKRFADTLLPG